VWASEPLGHRSVVEGLWRAHTQGRLSHALLFQGAAGIGKFMAARWFVQGLACAAGPAAPCGDCGPCKRLAAGSFADIFIIDALADGEDVLKVGYISPRDGGPEKTIESFLALRSAEGGLRAVIVREFERANESAQNALLKTLEEPGRNTLLILESAHPDVLLATVRSRCICVDFGALSWADTALILARAGFEGAAAEQCSRWSGGSPGLALELQRGSALEVREILARVLSGQTDPLLASTEVLGLKAEFAGKTPAAQTRTQARAALRLVLGILHDVLALHAGADPESLAHGDLARGRKWSPACTAMTLRCVLDLCAESNRNIAAESLLDRAFLALREAERMSRPRKAAGASR
jgi:hypothetical protein